MLPSLEKNTVLRGNDYVMLADGSHVVILSIDGGRATCYDEDGEREVALKDIVHIHHNLDDSSEGDDDATTTPKV